MASFKISVDSKSSLPAVHDWVIKRETCIGKKDKRLTRTVCLEEQIDGLAVFWSADFRDTPQEAGSDLRVRTDTCQRGFPAGIVVKRGQHAAERGTRSEPGQEGGSEDGRERTVHSRS